MAGDLKTATLRRGQKGFGFTLAEQFPCYLSNVQPGGVAENAGYRQGDQVVAVGNVDVTRMPHSEIVQLLADSGNKLTLTVRTRKTALKSLSNLHNMEPSETVVSKRNVIQQPEHQNNNNNHPYDGHWTDGQSSIDSDSPIWRQQKLGAECRLHAGSLRRHQQSAGAGLTTVPYAMVNAAGSNSKNTHGKNGNNANFDYASGIIQKKKGRKSREKPGNYAGNSNNFGGYYENSLPSSLRGKRGKSAAAAKQRSGKKGAGYSSAREQCMNRSLSEPDFLAENNADDFSPTKKNGGIPTGVSKSRPNLNVTSSMIAHADSGSSDMSTDDDSESEIDNDRYTRDRSVTTSESGENTSNDSAKIVSMVAEKDENLIFQSVVVYIGAVPVPNLGEISKRHVIRSALQSLRAQKAKARTVLMQVLADQVVVTNSRGSVTHRLLVSRIAFATACNENKQYFGLCTIHPQEPSSSPNSTKSSLSTTGNSDNFEKFGANMQIQSSPQALFSVCHMFAADPQLHLHSFHYNYAKKFGIACSRDPETGFCLEFPYISSPVLHALAYARRAVETAQLRQESASSINPNAASAESNQRNRRNQASSSTTKLAPSYISSASDSGIGGRECELPKGLRGGSNPSGGYSSAASSSTAIESSGNLPRNYGGGGGNLKKKSVEEHGREKNGGLKVTFEEPLIKAGKNPTKEEITVEAEVHGEFGEERRAFDGKKFASKRSEKSEKITFTRSTSTANNDGNTGTNAVAFAMGSFRQTGIGNGSTSTFPRKPKGREESAEKSSGKNWADTLPRAKSHQEFPQSAETGRSIKSIKSIGKIDDSPGNSGPKIAARGILTERNNRPNSCSNVNKVDNNNHLQKIDNCSSRNIGDQKSSKSIISSNKSSTVNGPIDKFQKIDKVDRSDNNSLRKSLDCDLNFAPTTIGSWEMALAVSTHEKDFASTHRSTGTNSSQRKKQQLHSEAEKTPSIPEFDQMLEDPVMRKPFEDFLKHQFCGENLTFWLGVENYKNASSVDERAQLGKCLFDNHFSDGCLEPVNVDSVAMHLIETASKTSDFPATLFDGPQYQIFHLMKYDCWPRFLKSEFAQKRGQSQENLESGPEPRSLTGQKDRSGSVASLSQGQGQSKGFSESTDKQKESKRKSLIPWKGKFITSRRKKEGRAESVQPDSSQQPSQHPQTHGSSSAPDLPNTKISGAPPHPNKNQRLSGAQAQAGGSLPNPESPGGNSGRMSLGGGLKKAGWKAGKQLSVPSEFYSAPANTVPALSASTSPQRRHEPLEEVHGGPLDMEVEPSTSGVETDGSQRERRCVAILPNGRRTPVQIPEGMTVRQWLNSLGNQFGFNPAGTELFDQNSGAKIDFTGAADRTLGDKIVRLETSVLFKLELPFQSSSSQENEGEGREKNKKLIAIRARSEHAAGLVLKPVLSRYGLDLDNLVICLSGSTEVLPNSAPIKKADNRKLVVLSHQEFQDWVHAPSSSGSTSPAIPRCTGAQGSTGSSSSSASSPTDYFGEQGPNFQEISSCMTQSASGLPVTVGIAELPPKRRKGKMALPSSSNDGKGDMETDSGAISGMLKFVRNKTNTPTMQQQQQHCATTTGLTPLNQTDLPTMGASKSAGTIGVSPKFSRKSLNVAPSIGANVAPSGAELKRQTVSSAKDIAEQLKQDRALGELLTRAQNRLDDQRGTSPMTYELPEFLRTEANAKLCQRQQTERPMDLIEDSEKDTDLFLDAENDLDFAEDCVIPTADQAEEFFASAGGSAPEFSGGETQEFTERKALKDYGFLESVTMAESESSNVSVITVSDDSPAPSVSGGTPFVTPAMSPLVSALTEGPAKRKNTPHSHGMTSSLRCRPPPPPYPGKFSTCQQSAETGGNSTGVPAPILPPGRTRAPVYVPPPSSYNAPVSNKEPLNSDVWRVDYV